MTGNGTAGARLRWRCRRGLLELDLILLQFLEQQYHNLNTAEQHAFSDLLEVPDDTLLSYLNGRNQPPNDELKHIVDKIK